MSISHGQLAKRFADGATSGRGARMFIDGDTIYSHGYHWPIAKRIGHEFLVNPEKRSHSTASHTREVWTHLPSGVTYEAPQCRPKLIPRYRLEQARLLAGKILRARKQGILCYLVDSFEENYQAWLKSAERFNLTCPEIGELHDSEAIKIKILESKLKGDK